MDLYNSMIKIESIYYLQNWILYMDLIETKNNIENITFYNWESIEHHELYYLLDMYKKNINDNIDIIIDIVKSIVIDITNQTNGYNINDNIIDISFELVQCEKCGNIWDGNAQCNCYKY